MRKCDKIALMTNKEKIESYLNVLKGLALSVARQLAATRGFHFGQIYTTPQGASWGDYILHISCAWRIENDDGIIVGLDDYWDPPGEEAWHEDWNKETDQNLLDLKLADLFKDFSSETKSFVNQTGELVVESVEATEFGDLSIHLTGGYKIKIFTSHSEDENWVFFNGEHNPNEFFMSVDGGKATITSDWREKNRE
jgi:hypothetical protein